MNKQSPPEGFDENPEWTAETSARAKPGNEMHPAHVVAALTRRPRGRPAGSDKGRVTLRVDNDILERFKATGPGWQSRMNEALRKAVGL